MKKLLLNIFCMMTLPFSSWAANTLPIEGRG